MISSISSWWDWDAGSPTRLPIVLVGLCPPTRHQGMKGLQQHTRWTRLPNGDRNPHLFLQLLIMYYLLLQQEIMLVYAISYHEHYKGSANASLDFWVVRSSHHLSPVIFWWWVGDLHTFLWLRTLKRVPFCCVLCHTCYTGHTCWADTTKSSILLWGQIY